MCDCIKEALGYIFVGASIIGAVGIGVWIGWIVRGDLDDEISRNKKH